MTRLLDEAPPLADLVALYRSVGWAAYASDPERLARAVAASTATLAAWQGERLVGFARAIGDGAHVTFLADLLVAPDAQRAGVGRALLEAVRERAEGRLVLLTDADGPRAFYESAGLTEASALGLVGYVAVP